MSEQWNAIPQENLVNTGGTGTEKHIQARVWDVHAEQWVVVEVVDAKDGLRLGGYSLTQPE